MTGTVRLVVSRALTAAVVASLLVLPFAQLAQAAVDAPAAPVAVEAIDTTAAAPLTGAVPTVTLDANFTPLPRGSSSPWDGEVVLDGIDGLSYNTPGTEVKVRAMSSNAFFVDEVWLVYPRVQYLFNNKDVLDFGGGFQDISFSDWITVGTFPPGTELIFGVKTGVGIDDKCQDRTNPNGSVDRHHCYKVTQDPTWVPLAPDPKRTCLITDDACRNKAWPSQTPDGRSIFYTGPGLRNVKDNSPHGRFQYLSCAVRPAAGQQCPADKVLTNTALFGLEDVGAPVTRTGGACPGAKELASLKTTTEVVVSPTAQTVGVSSLTGLSVGGRLSITQPFQRETVTITAINVIASTITAVFATPDNKPYPAGTSWAPDGCDWHPDFQDAGIVVWPALAATCQSTAVKDKVVIVGQEGYGTVTIRDTTRPAPFTQTFAPGDQITFSVAASGLGTGVSGVSPNWSIQLGKDVNGNAGQALMTITDLTKPLGDANRTLDAGLCYDPGNPPLPLINAIVGSSTCDAGWDFTISNVTTATAPPSIRVTWTNDQTPPADEAATIPLSSVGADGVAHYRSDLHTSLRVVGATTTAPSLAWVGSTGSFKMETGPCPVNKVADVTAACPVPGATAWDITISGTTQHQAPSKVKVTWEGGAQADVALSGPVGVDGIARYATSLNLDEPITEATAFIQGTWSGAFKVNGATCPGKKQLTLTAVPACTAGVAKWDFAISNMTATLAPASVSALWAGQSAPEAVALTGTVSADGIAHYTTAAHTGTSYAALVSVTAQITFPSDADAAAFTGTLTAPGVPCAPPPSPSPSPSPSITPGLGRCEPIYNPAGKHIPTAGENPKSGQNPDGFYRLAGPAGWTVRIKDTQSSYITPPFATGTTIKLTEANGKTPTFAPGAGAINYHVWLKGDAELQFFDANGALMNKAVCHVPTHPKGDPEPCVTASPSPRPTPTRTPSPSPKPGSGTGTGGSKAGTRGASSAGSSAGTNSKTNSGTASKSAGGTNTGTNGASNSGSNSGTNDRGSRAGTGSRTNNGSGSRTNDGSGSHTVGQSGSRTNDDSGTGTRTNDGSGSRTKDTGGTSAGTNAGTKSGSCSTDGDEPKPSATPKPSHTPKPSQTPKPSETPKPSQTPKPSASPTTPPPSASPTNGIIQVKTSTLLQHECNSSEWHFVITSVNLLTAPLTISVTWSNGQSAVVPLEKVSGGTAHYRTKLNLDSQVTGATAAMSGSYGQFNVSHGPCKVLLGNTTESSATPKPSETPKPSVTPSPSPTTSNGGSSGGTRTITLKVKAPGGGYQYVTVTVPR